MDADDTMDKWSYYVVQVLCHKSVENRLVYLVEWGIGDSICAKPSWEPKILVPEYIIEQYDHWVTEEEYQNFLK